MAKPKDAGHVYQIQTVPPPSGETDAYSAPTKVGPMPAAIAEMISEATRQAHEEEDASAQKKALRARPIIPREEPDDPLEAATPTKPPPSMSEGAGAPSSRSRPISTPRTPSPEPPPPAPPAPTRSSPNEPTPAVIAAAMLQALEAPPPVTPPPASSSSPSNPPVESALVGSAPSSAPGLTPPLHSRSPDVHSRSPDVRSPAPAAKKPKSRVVTILLLAAIFGLVALAGYRLVFRRLH